MRLAFDSQIFCFQHYGGISRYFVSLAEQFSALGIETAFFAPLHQNNYLNTRISSLVHGKYTHSYPFKTGPFFRAYNHFAARSKIAEWSPDVIHETYFSSVAAGPQSIPVVITVHDMIHERFPEFFRFWDQTAKIKKKAIKRADHILCVSENTRIDLLNVCDVDSERVSVVHHGFDAFQTTIENYFSLDQPYILYVGQRTGYKNFERFVRAFASSSRLSKDVMLVAFGGGSFSRKEIEFFSALKLKKDSYRQISGSDDLLGQLYRNAICFVYPSLYEGFGLPPLEAMSVNCPVVSSNTSSMPEVIGDAAEYFDPLSVESIATSIENVVYSRSLSQDLIDRGQQRIKLFSWEKCAKQTLAAYSKCL